MAIISSWQQFKDKFVPKYPVNDADWADILDTLENANQQVGDPIVFAYRVGVAAPLITDPHLHIAYLRVSHLQSLIVNNNPTVTISSNEVEGHSHDITISYNKNTNRFIVENITSESDHIHTAYLIGEGTGSLDSPYKTATIGPVDLSQLGGGLEVVRAVNNTVLVINQVFIQVSGSGNYSASETYLEMKVAGRTVMASPEIPLNVSNTTYMRSLSAGSPVTNYDGGTESSIVAQLDAPISGFGLNATMVIVYMELPDATTSLNSPIPN